jgi:hypothetical protein
MGWQLDKRQKNLQLVANIARFLILPRVQSTGLGGARLKS